MLQNVGPNYFKLSDIFNHIAIAVYFFIILIGLQCLIVHHCLKVGELYLSKEVLPILLIFFLSYEKLSGKTLGIYILDPGQF